MIDKDLIENRIKNYWGYGNLNSDTWFVGMEEGFDGSLSDLEKRFNKTKDRCVIDIKSDMQDVPDHFKWFSPNAPSQRTWSKLILILLMLYSSEEVSLDVIKKYQRNNFARLNSDHCVLEFMPFPCKSVRKKDWFYDQFKIDYLETRKTYLKHVMPIRIELFKKLLKKHSPKVVIFYSLSYLDKWSDIISEKFSKNENLYHCKQDSTHFFVIPHPVAYGLKNSDWIDIACNIKRLSRI